VAVRYISAFVLAVALIVVAPAADADSHLDKSQAFIRDLADRAVENLTNKEFTTEEQRLKFQELFREGFAVDGIARFVAGRYWRRASKSEREEYLVLFEDVVVNIWSDRLFSQYNGQQFDILGARDDTPANSQELVAVVESRIQTTPHTSVKVEWRVASLGELTKIVDVKVEGRSLAKTQQDEFTGFASKNGRRFSAIIEELRRRRDG